MSVGLVVICVHSMAGTLAGKKGSPQFLSTSDRHS